MKIKNKQQDLWTVVPQNQKNKFHIRESVDSMYGWRRQDTPIFQNRMAQNSQTRQLQTLLDTYTYSTNDSVPAKTLKVGKIHSYNDLWNLPHTPFLFFLFIIFFLLLQLNCPTAKAAQVESTVLGFYMKRLLSLACVILYQENLRNFTRNCIIANFPYLLEAIFCMVTCISCFIESRWGSSARAGPRE